MPPRKEGSARGRSVASQPTERRARVRRGQRNNPTEGQQSGRPRGPRAPRVNARGNIAAGRERVRTNPREDRYTARMNRQATGLSNSQIPLLSTRESLAILHGYLDDCERNLSEGEMQRAQLAQMVSNLREPTRTYNTMPIDPMNFSDDLIPYQGNNIPIDGHYDVQDVEPLDPMLPNDNQPYNELPELIGALRYVAQTIVGPLLEAAAEQPQHRDAATAAGGDAAGFGTLLSPPTLIEGIDLLAAGDGYHVVPINTVQLTRSADNILAFVLELNNSSTAAPVPQPSEDSDQD